MTSSAWISLKDVPVLGVPSLEVEPVEKRQVSRGALLVRAGVASCTPDNAANAAMNVAVETATAPLLARNRGRSVDRVGFVESIRLPPSISVFVGLGALAELPNVPSWSITSTLLNSSAPVSRAMLISPAWWSTPVLFDN
jgi:hypothetical protein